MTTSSAFWAYGSLFQMGDGKASEGFSTIGEIIDITPPSMSKDSIEVKSQDSTSGYAEFIPGWRDGGEATFNCNWLPTDTTQDEDTGLLASFNDDDNHNWKIVLPDTIKTLSFTGHVTNFEGDLPLEEQGELAITIKISGVVTPS